MPTGISELSVFSQLFSSLGVFSLNDELIVALSRSSIDYHTVCHFCEAQFSWILMSSTGSDSHFGSLFIPHLEHIQWLFEQFVKWRVEELAFSYFAGEEKAQLA